MKNPDLFDESHSATYCPEDDKLRLYVGRVPRDEYLALKAEGWTSTPKQDCNFVAIWTPSRENTALSYAGVILDEDSGPEERAADRAERFGGYLEKRAGEALALAGTYHGREIAHGYQSADRAERSASRHDRIAGRAVNAWDKAEYWDRRTAGVIAHRLHLSSPGVRMGRIKTLEAELRKLEKSELEHRQRFERWVWVAEAPDPACAFERAKACANVESYGGDYTHPRTGRKASLYSLLNDPEEPITGAEAADMWLECQCPPPDHPFYFEIDPAQRSIRHLRLRLAYENQMLEAQGGRAASIEIEPGGTWGGMVIVKVCKSTVTGRVTSVFVKGLRVEGWSYNVESPAGKDYSLHRFETERAAPGTYSPPTPEGLAVIAAMKEENKEARKKAKEAGKGPLPIINPTLDDAQRLQTLLNDRHKADYMARNKGMEKYYPADAPKEVTAINQATYSANSKGSYARAETRGLCADGKLYDRVSNMWSSEAKERARLRGPAVCMIRVTGYDPVSIIHLTDKPTKPLPAAVWAPYSPKNESH